MRHPRRKNKRRAERGVRVVYPRMVEMGCVSTAAPLDKRKNGIKSEVINPIKRNTLCVTLHNANSIITERCAAVPVLVFLLSFVIRLYVIAVIAADACRPPFTEGAHHDYKLSASLSHERERERKSLRVIRSYPYMIAVSSFIPFHATGRGRERFFSHRPWDLDNSMDTL